MEYLKENSYTISLLYIIVGVIIFPATILYNILFWSVASLSQPYIWLNLTFITYPIFTAVYVASVLITAYLSTHKRKVIHYRS